MADNKANDDSTAAAEAAAIQAAAVEAAAIQAAAVEVAAKEAAAQEAAAHNNQEQSKPPARPEGSGGATTPAAPVNNSTGNGLINPESAQITGGTAVGNTPDQDWSDDDSLNLSNDGNAGEDPTKCHGKDDPMDVEQPPPHGDSASSRSSTGERPPGAGPHD